MTRAGGKVIYPLIMSADFKRCWVEIDLGALAANYQALACGLPAGVEILAVVKANAYGHGAVPVARRLAAEGCRSFGVAQVAEAQELRRGKIRGRILVLSHLEAGEIPVLFQSELTPVVDRIEMARAISRVAGRRRIKNFPIHLKVDTGMGRLGLIPAEIPRFLRDFRRLKNLRIDGVMTHLSEATDLVFTRSQRREFQKAIRLFLDAGCHPFYTHSSNSAAVILRRSGGDNLVRTGLALYGAYPENRLAKPGLSLKPVLVWKTRIQQIKKIPPGYRVGYGKMFLNRSARAVAILPVGYADGYSRSLSNRGEVLVRGKRAPVIGSVCMDLTMVEVGKITSARAGDEVTLLGRDGMEEIRVEEMAAWAGTIPYEIFTSISGRVSRVYRG